ncbi:MAG TPA: hypothetical protein VF764_12210 [Steroidobacteraceae bacterium]
MKNDFFRRGVRMQHQFGETEKVNDPMGTGTFPPPDFPLPGAGVKRFSGTGTPCEVQEYGEYQYRTPSSPIQKPSGDMASHQGPSPDAPQIFGFSFPVGTKRRSGIGGPLKTDK